MNNFDKLMKLAKSWTDVSPPPSYAQQTAMLQRYDKDQTQKKAKRGAGYKETSKPTLTTKSTRKPERFSAVTQVKKMSRENIGQIPKQQRIGDKRFKQPKYKKYEDE